MRHHLLALFLAGILAVTGCTTEVSLQDDDRTRIVQGANGQVEIPHAPERIVVLWRPTLAA